MDEYNDSYPQGEEAATGLLFLGNLTFISIMGKFKAISYDVYDCRVAGSYDFVIDSTEQEWPFNDEHYS